MVELIVYLLTLAGVGTVAILEFLHDLRDKTENARNKDKKRK